MGFKIKSYYGRAKTVLKLFPTSEYPQQKKLEENTFVLYRKNDLRRIKSQSN